MQKLKEDETVRLKQFMLKKMEFAEICCLSVCWGAATCVARLSCCDEKQPRAPERGHSSR